MQDPANVELSKTLTSLAPSPKKGKKKKKRPVSAYKSPMAQTLDVDEESKVTVSILGNTNMSTIQPAMGASVGGTISLEDLHQRMKTFSNSATMKDITELKNVRAPPEQVK